MHNKIVLLSFTQEKQFSMGISICVPYYDYKTQDVGK